MTSTLQIHAIHRLFFTSVFCWLASLASAEPIETELPGVTAEVLELRQQSGILRLAIRLTNGTEKEAKDSGALKLADVVLVDAKTKKKHFSLRAADQHYLGGPVSDWNDGGRWFAHIPARSEAILWTYYEPLPVGSVVSIQAPKMFPFENVQVTEGPVPWHSNNEAPSELNGVKLTLVSAERAEQRLTIRLKLAATKPGRSAPILYRDVFLFDSQSKRKYPILKDAEGKFLAQPMTDSNDGGRYWVSGLKPGGIALMSLVFMAPPDETLAGDLLIPSFTPLEGVQLAGKGGAAVGGIAAAGQSLSLEGALKDLQAEVTATEITINLSADVLFDFDKSDLKPAAEGQLQKLLTVVRAKPSAKISVVGHTDVRGAESYNQQLSERRAQAVRDWLVGKDTGQTRVTTRGAGESQPLKSGDSEEDHQANRRVEIRIRE